MVPFSITGAWNGKCQWKNVYEIKQISWGLILLDENLHNCCLLNILIQRSKSKIQIHHLLFFSSEALLKNHGLGVGFPFLHLRVVKLHITLFK